MTYPNGDQTSYVSTVFDATVVGGSLGPDGAETSDVRWFDVLFCVSVLSQPPKNTGRRDAACQRMPPFAALPAVTPGTIPWRLAMYGIPVEVKAIRAATSPGMAPG
jgi:hypothetical protein